MQITDEHVNEAIDWLYNKAPTLIGQARRNHTALEHKRKVVLAIQYRLSNEKTDKAKENEALASEKFEQHIEELAKADAQLASVYAIRDKHQMILEQYKNRRIETHIASKAL